VVRRVSVLIADDDAAVREALADLLSDESSLTLVALATTADEAIEIADHERPDVALLDVRMPGGGGPRAAREIALCSPSTRCLALSVREEHASVYDMLAAGASGYLVKGASDREIVEAIHRAARLQLSMPAELATSFFRELMQDVSEAKKVGLSLQKSEEKFRGLLESAPDAKLVVDRQGVIEEVNSRAEQLFGYRREELVGRAADMLLPHGLREAWVRSNAVWADVAERVRAEQTMEFVVRRKDTTRLPVDVSLSPMETEHGRLAVATIHDISERKRAKEIERKLEERFRALLDSTPDAMVIADITGAIQLVNVQAEQLFGFTRDELVGQPMETLLPERFHRAHVLDRAKFMERPERRPMGLGPDLAGRRQDGSEFPIDITLSAITTDAGNLMVAGIRDVTERKRSEQQLEASVELVRKTERERQELLVHLVRAQEAERVRIAADIHDDSIQAMAAAALRLQQLRKRLSTETEVEALDKLEEAFQGALTRLRHLMFNLRPLALERSGLAAALQAQLEQIQSEASLRFELADHLTAEPPPETRVILYRIAMEALVNIRKHARADLVLVRLENSDGGWRVQIDDDGSGFTPADNGSAPGHLGLTVMRERAQLAGGWWKIESRPGAGTSVAFWLPVVAEPPPASATASTTA
jgi:PAS domain S-box-containing protein